MKPQCSWLRSEWKETILGKFSRNIPLKHGKYLQKELKMSNVDLNWLDYLPWFQGSKKICDKLISKKSWVCFMCFFTPEGRQVFSRNSLQGYQYFINVNADGREGSPFFPNEIKNHRIKKNNKKTRRLTAGTAGMDFCCWHREKKWLNRGMRFNIFKHSVFNYGKCDGFHLKIWVVATQIFFMFIPIWGRFPFGLIFFKGVETTN